MILQQELIWASYAEVDIIPTRLVMVLVHKLHLESTPLNLLGQLSTAMQIVPAPNIVP